MPSTDFNSDSRVGSAPRATPGKSSTPISDPAFLTDVIHGLSLQPRRIQCKYFYDQRGSQLFDQICQLDEYYLTRTELAIMDQYLGEMAWQIGSQAMLVEFGSGSSTKTRKLLASLEDPVAYVPIDISEEHLIETSRELQQLFPQIEILPVVADFTSEIELPESTRKYSHAAVYFPGSTIGNFQLHDAQNLLRRFARTLGPRGGMLIGIDLQKDPKILEAAYDDNQGVTAEFNLNVLHRINRELNANFDIASFNHRAVYNHGDGRIEMYLVSAREQSVQIADRTFEFAKDEAVLTEYSHKYTIDGFADLAAQAKFSLHKYWTDPDKLFAVLHLVNERE